MHLERRARLAGELKLVSKLLIAVGSKNQRAIKACADTLRRLDAAAFDDRDDKPVRSTAPTAPAVPHNPDITDAPVSQDAEVTEIIEISQDTEVIEVDEHSVNGHSVNEHSVHEHSDNQHGDDQHGDDQHGDFTERSEVTGRFEEAPPRDLESADTDVGHPSETQRQQEASSG